MTDLSATGYATHELLAVEVRGTPVPQGSIRSLGKGRPSIHSNADRLKPWRAQMQTAIEEAADAVDVLGYNGPVGVAAVFTMPKPKSAPKRRATYPIARPDVDKLLRACLDAIQASGVIRDDSQVVHAVAVKAYPGEHPNALPVPGAHIRIFTIEGVQ